METILPLSIEVRDSDNEVLVAVTYNGRFRTSRGRRQMWQYAANYARRLMRLHEGASFSVERKDGKFAWEPA